MLHVIPVDGLPHAPTPECGCSPVLGPHSGRAAALIHRTPDDTASGDAGDNGEERADHAVAGELD